MARQKLPGERQIWRIPARPSDPRSDDYRFNLNALIVAIGVGTALASASATRSGRMGSIRSASNGLSGEQRMKRPFYAACMAIVTAFLAVTAAHATSRIKDL